MPLYQKPKSMGPNFSSMVFNIAAIAPKSPTSPNATSASLKPAPRMAFSQALWLSGKTYSR